MGRLCSRAPSGPVFRQKSHGMGTCFCRHGTNFIERWCGRGTSLIGTESLSPVTKLVAGTGAVSRYNLSRSQKFVKVQDFNCVQKSVSGCNNHYESVLSTGAKAKSVTTCPAFSIKKRETTYPYCPCYSVFLFFILVLKMQTFLQTLQV